jgi:uncharacterized membrane protein affecting hemolysin expression
MKNNQGKQPIRVLSEKSMVVFCIVIMVILLCGILQFRS